MDRRRAAGLLLALAACFATATAAPTASNHTSLDLYDGAPEGCYYNFQRYGEGDRIMTNEPCLNCTCHNRMLMCYLRVCPFTKPIGQDCTIEKRADQCCPIVTCPDVPVDLLTSTTTSPAEYGSTGMGKLDKFGCSINGKYFPEGSKVPPTPNKPCEHCYCIRNMTTCVMQECTLHVDGCTPIYHKDVCCPVRYSCDHPEDEMPLLDDLSTTVRPTPGFLLTTTTISPVTQMSQDCVYDNKVFPDGALIKTEKACDHCYCMKGDIVCVVQECGTPMENEGKNCTALSPREGVCCPDTYICEGDEPTTGTYEYDITTQETTTLTPPRRTISEGSGYRNEPDEVPYTKIPVQEPEVEGSGEEEELKPTEISSISSTEIIDDLATTEDTHEYIPLTTSKPTGEITPAVDVKDDESMVTSAEVDTNSEPLQNLPSTTVAPQLVSEDSETVTKQDLSQDVGSGEADEDINVTQKDISTTSVPKIEKTEGITNLYEQDLVTPVATTQETSEYSIPTTTSVSVKETEKTNEPMQDIISNDENEAITSITSIENATPIIPASDEIITISTEYPEKAIVTNKPDDNIEKETIQPHHYLPSSKAPNQDDDFVTTESQEQELVTETAINSENLEPQQQITASTPMLEEIEKDTTEFIEPGNIIHIDATQDSTFDTTSTSTKKPDKELTETTINGVDIYQEPTYSTTNIPVFDQQEILTVEPNSYDSVEPEQFSTTTRNDALDESGRRTTPDLPVTTSRDGEMPHEFSASTTSPASEFEATTEPDKGLNTIPSDIVEEEPMSPEIQKTTTLEENIATESDLTSKFESDISDTKQSTISPEILVSRDELSTSTTEPAFRKEDSSPNDSQENLEITTTPATATEKIITTSVHGIKATESTIDLQHTIDTTVQPMHTETIEEVTLPKEDTNVPNYESSTSEIPTSEKEYVPGEEIITTAPQYEIIPETSTANQDDNEIFNEPRIPGEGDCLLNGVTYTNESAVPSTNKCQSGCKCVSSIVKCDPIICSPPPEYMNNCQPMYDSPEACCPTYICDHKTETIPPQSHSQMSGTEAPVILPVHCDGDECEISRDKEVSVVNCESGRCTGTSDDLEIADLQPTQSILEQPVSNQKPCEGEKCKKTEVTAQVDHVSCVDGENCSSIDIPTKECSTGNCDQIESGSEKECKEGNCKNVVSSSLDQEVPEQCSEPGCKQTQTGSETESSPSILQQTSQGVDNNEAPVNSNDVIVTEKTETVPHDVLTTRPHDNGPTIKVESGSEDTTKPVISIDQAEEDKIKTESSTAPSKEYTSETQEPTESYKPIDVTKVAPEEYFTEKTITTGRPGSSSNIEPDTGKPDYATPEAPKINDETIEHVETTIKSFQDSTTKPSKLHTNEPQETTEITERYNNEDITKKIVEEYMTESTPSSNELTLQPNLQESSETSKPISTESEGVTKSPIESGDMGIPSAVTEASDVAFSSDSTKSPKIVTTDKILGEDYTESSVAENAHEITRSPQDQETSTKYYTDLNSIASEMTSEDVSSASSTSKMSIDEQEISTKPPTYTTDKQESTETPTAESNEKQTSKIIDEPVTKHYEVTKSEDVDSQNTTIMISEETSEPTKIVEKGPEVASPEDVTSKILTTSATDLPIFPTNAYDQTKSSEEPIGSTVKDVNEMPNKISQLESDTDSNKQTEKETETDKPTVVEIGTEGPTDEDKLITESGSGVTTTLSSTDSKITEPETASTSPYYSESHSSSDNEEQTQITLSATEPNLRETTQTPIITDNEIPDHTKIEKVVPEVSTDEPRTTSSEIRDITTLKPIVTQDEKTKTEYPGESSPQDDHTQNILEVVTEETSIITGIPTTVSEVEKISELPAEENSTKEEGFEFSTTEISSEGKPIHDETYTIQPIHAHSSPEPTLGDDITKVYSSEDMSTIELHNSEKSEKPEDDLAQSLVTRLYDATTKPLDLDFQTSTSILGTTLQPIESDTTMTPDQQKSSEKTTTLQSEPSYTTVGKYDEKSDVVTPKDTVKPIDEEIQTESTLDTVTFKDHTQEIQITEITEAPKSTESPDIPSETEAPLPKPLPEDNSSLLSNETTTELSEILTVEQELTTRTSLEKTETPITLEATTPKDVTSESTADIANTDKSTDTPIEEHTTIENVRETDSSDNVPLSPELNTEKQPEQTGTFAEDTFDDKYLTTEKLKEPEQLQTTQPTVADTVEMSTHSSVLPEEGSMTADGRRTTSVLNISPSVEITTPKSESLIPAIDVMDIEKTSEDYNSVPVQTERVIPASENSIVETTAPEEEFIVATSKATTAIPDVEISTKSVTEDLNQPIPTVLSEPISTKAPEMTVSEIQQDSVTKSSDELVTTLPEYAITTEPESVITFTPEESITTVPESLITASKVPLKPMTNDTITIELETSETPLVTAEMPVKPTATEIEVPASNVLEEHATKTPTTTDPEFSLATDTNVPEAFITNAPKEQATEAPEISISSAPDVPSMTASEKITTGASESPEAPITSPIEATVTSTSEEALLPSTAELYTTSAPKVLTTTALEELVTSADKGPIPSIPESDTTLAPEVLATSASEVPATSQDEVPVPTTPESYATRSPEVLATSAPEVPATSQNEVTRLPIPESYATSAPDIQATSAPIVPATSQDEVQVPTTPESSATPAPEASASEVPATLQDEVPVPTTPKSYTATAPEALATSAPEIPVTSQDAVQSFATTAPEALVTSQDEVSISTTPKSHSTTMPEVLVTSTPEVPASIQDEVTISPTPESDATLVPEVLVTSAAEVPTTLQDIAPVPTTPKSYASTAPEVLATLVPEVPATTQDEITVPATLESDATLAPEVLVTSAPKVPATAQDEVLVSTTPKSYATTVPESLATSAPTVSVTSADVVPEPHETEEAVTSAPEIPTASADDALVPLTPESHATLAPEIAATSAPKEPITTVPETPTTSAPEVLTSSTAEIMATSTSEGPVATASEIPVTKAPEEGPSTSAPELPKPTFTESHPMEELPTEEDGSFPTGGTSGYGQEPDYVEEDQTFGPGTCRYGGKVYVSAQQIPRDDPCDFCFCFRSDIICLQQSCPPPIHGCHEEPIQGFCCPRYECPVSMATTVNVTTTTTTTTTTLPPHFPTHPYKGSAQKRGCQIKGQTYTVGEVVRASSGPCLQCTCGGDGRMKCDPRTCTPEPMLRQMIAAAVSAKRRR